MPPDTSPLYVKGVHVLDGLTDEEMDHLLEEHPMIIPLFEIDFPTTVLPYVSELDPQENKDPHKPYPQSIEELRHAHDVLDVELTIS